MNKIIIPLSYDNKDAQAMIRRLDDYQVSLYGIENCNLDSIQVLKRSGAYMLGTYHNDYLVGMGAVKLFDSYAEIKRMFIDEHYRGRGIAKEILTLLEIYAKKAGKTKLCLETGFLQDIAISFYKKSGYKVISKFGNYKPNLVSIYFFKEL